MLTCGKHAIGDQTTDGRGADVKRFGGLIECCLAALGALALAIDGDVVVIAQSRDAGARPGVAFAGRRPSAVENRGAFGDFDERHRVDAAASKRSSAAERRCHIAYDATTRRYRPTMKCFSRRIEAHQHVRRHCRLRIPDHIVNHGDGVRSGVPPARRRPLGHLSGLWIQSPEIPRPRVRAAREARRRPCNRTTIVLSTSQFTRRFTAHIVSSELPTKARREFAPNSGKRKWPHADFPAAGSER